ncbi:hypothetical protein PR202_gb08931 [Eleusine coracana subsp. coracana]|uniref:Transducin/WD40 repeat-like superfamily protein n=1 Tax=Eleusine coracana subsp. coracana TaxID=191504 RepID=A0AAV5EFM5_ELECO|nr:hypothetical protein PR202_gb08931 [Eleusine coracana subsp. coracana]
MEKFLEAAPPKSGEGLAPPPLRRHQWRRIAVELDGRIDAREGVSAIEFDKKGIYLASVTFSGCLTVHDFETLYCSKYGPSYIYVFHCGVYMVQVACTSSQSEKIFLFDIGYVSSAPTEILQKGKSKFPALYSESRKSLTDLAFASDDKSRTVKRAVDNFVDLRACLVTACHILPWPGNRSGPQSQFILQTVFGASKNGTIYAWDLRGGRTSAAFQSHNEIQPLLSVKISTLLGKIASLKEQSNIVSSPILSIDFNPCCSYQLAFHLEDGWSGVLNVNSLIVTHLHCPPPAWLDGMDLALQKHLSKPTWLPTSSIYAVGSYSHDGIYLLDFHPDTSAACHVDYCSHRYSCYRKSTRLSETRSSACLEFPPSYFRNGAFTGLFITLRAYAMKN